MRSKITILRSYLKYRNVNRFKSREHIHRYQEKKLRGFLKVVEKHSEYYRNIFIQNGRKLENLPILDKSTMMTHFDDLVTVDITKEEAIELALGSEKTRDFSDTYNQLTVGLSSGTSGHRGVFLASRKECDIWTGAILARTLPSILGTYKIAFFLRANSNLYENVGSRRICFKYFDIYKSMDEHIETLSSFQPDLLVAPPSVLLVLADAIEKGSLDIKPGKVISVAEVLEDSDRDYFKKVFKQAIIHQVYQCTEGFLGYTCEHGTLHLNEDVVYIEKSYIDDKRFVPIITDYTRTSQPIIRYRLNDVLVEKEEACPCGSHFIALSAIEGREDDVFIFKGTSGEEVHVFPDLIRRCILHVDNISQYQVIQERSSEIRILLDYGEDLNQISTRENIIDEFHKIADQLNFEMPRIRFGDYEHTVEIKLKRVIKQ